MSKEIKGFRPGSKSWKQFMAKLYGIGGAVVIVGALFKIQHWPGSDITLIAGLGTEAIIFFFSAFEPPHEDPDWTLVYPELAVPSEIDEIDLVEENKEEETPEEFKGSITEQLDNMLEEAKIGPELIQSLGEGLRSLSDQTEKLSNLTDASLATDDYVRSVQTAAKSVDDLADNYAKASESLTNIAVSNEEGQTYGEQLNAMSKNLSELNAVYELQLKGSNDHLDTTNRLFNGMGELMQSLNDSIEDTKRYKENMSELTANLNSLNTVYGNMLNAMNFNPGNNQQS